MTTNLQLMAGGVTLTQDNGKFLDTQLLEDSDLEWSASALGDAPTEARIYDDAGRRVARGPVPQVTKSASGEVSATGVITIPKRSARKAGVYKFAFYSGDREIASRTFLISIDLAAREAEEEAAAERAKTKHEAAEERARQDAAAAERTREQQLAQPQLVQEQEAAAAASAAAAQQAAQQQQELQNGMQTMQNLGNVMRTLPLHR